MLHPDFRQRVVYFKDYIAHQNKAYDDNGHGTHVSGIIAGNGMSSFGKYSGIAPASHLIELKILDKKGNGRTKDVIDGINWIVKHKEEYGIRIMNISVGMTLSAKQQDLINMIQAVEYAWDKGIVVVAAAGNNGPKEGSITAPGISRKIITVGAFDDTGEYLKEQGLAPEYSGCGPTKSCIVKPELVAPGTNIMSTIPGKQGYGKKSGTSMATPVVSGVAALLLSKYPQYTPKEVKMRLHERAVDLGISNKKQGWGMVDIQKIMC